MALIDPVGFIEVRDSPLGLTFSLREMQDAQYNKSFDMGHPSKIKIYLKGFLLRLRKSLSLTPRLFLVRSTDSVRR